MSIKDALVRQDDNDRIQIGEIVKRTMNGKFGEIFRAFINGLQTKEIEYNKTNPSDRMPLSADRLLGRIEGYHECLYGLERMIQDAEELQAPVEEEEDE